MKSKIDLNSIVFEERLTKEDILKHLTQEEIYSFYIGTEIKSGTRINSPLREDFVPSFSLFYHKTNRNSLMYYDFATKDSGDVVVFVSKLFGITYYQALVKIAYDFNLTGLNLVNDATRKHYQTIKKVVQKDQVSIGIKRRNWKVRDKKFWSQFGISKETLIKYNVYPISYVFFNGNAYKADYLAYAYVEFKDNIPTYKIYQPMNKEFKWINNANYSIHQGYVQLPDKGELLIITKSYKDLMSIHDVCGIPAIGLQSESVMMKDSVMEEYKSRFEKVVCLFDNDKAGVELSKQFSEHFNVPYFLMPEIKNVTDFSDLVKARGEDFARNTLNKKLKETI